MSEDRPKRDAGELLDATVRGEKAAAGELIPALYQELRRLARSRMAKLPPGQTLQTTALVHEAYLRIAGSRERGWDRRGHFFGAAACAMREILIEEARKKASLKRGGGRKKVDADEVRLAFETPAEDLLALDEALQRLEKVSPRKHELVMLRFFSGLSAEEAAAVMGVALRTVEREWTYVRAWLHAELNEPDEPLEEEGREKPPR